MIINYFKSFGITILGILLSILLLTTLNYFNIISSNIVKVLNIIIPSIWIFVGGFLVGKKANKKGYLEGIKFGLILTILFLLISILGIRTKFEIKSLLFYLILIVCSMIGSMIGINKNLEKE